MTNFKTIKHKLKVWLAKTLIHVSARFSLKNCHRIGSLFGWLLAKLPNRNRSVTEKNIELCFPELSHSEQKQLLKQSLIETGKTVIEASPMWQWDKNKLFSLIRKVHGEELIQQALDKNNGVILALPHLGNWELLGLYCSSKYTTTSMYQKPKMIEIDSIVKHGRERFGANLVPADHVGVKAMYKALKNNSCVCILPDQEPGKGNGVFAPFFGVPAYSMTLISRLAKKTKATVILAYSKRLPVAGGYEIIFSALPAMAEKLENVNPEDSVEYLNAEMEKHIRNISEQYQWSYKRFRTQPAEVLATLTGKDFYNL